jgi:hypothetical protein
MDEVRFPTFGVRGSGSAGIGGNPLALSGRKASGHPKVGGTCDGQKQEGWILAPVFHWASSKIMKNYMNNGMASPTGHPVKYPD